MSVMRDQHDEFSTSHQLCRPRGGIAGAAQFPEEGRYTYLRSTEICTWTVSGQTVVQQPNQHI
jgi:hypothetical protein